MGVSFKDDPNARGFFAPMRFEANIIDCEVEGDIPADIAGSFYRTALDRRFPPLYENDVLYNSDGAVDLLRIRNGHADFKSRYVRTERFLAERAERRALFGRYRNRSTNDPLARDLSLNTANTTPIYHAGKFFALKEDSPPTLMDPHSLKTLGEHDFGGRMTAKTFTAHPKIDPLTGEMIAFSYEATGDASDDLVVWFFDKAGNITREVWLKVPVVSMMHDFAITEKHVILPTTAMVTDRERLKRGEVHWAFDKSVPGYVGILPRDGEAKDVRWFKGTTSQCMLVHTTNARTEGDKVILDAPVAAGNFNPWFPNVDGSPYDPTGRTPTMRRWTFDLASSRDGWQEEILFNGLMATSFTRMDDRYLTRPFRYSFMMLTDKEAPFDDSLAAELLGPPINAWYRFDYTTGKIDKYFCGPEYSMTEPQFIPRRADAPEGDGYLIGAANNLRERRTDIIILDAQHIAEGPVARIRLPFRLHMQVHGWWVPEEELPFDS